MELTRINLEFEDQEINSLLKNLNDLFKSQQSDFAKLCYAVYKIDCWFVEHEDEVLRSKTNDYYNRKQLFKTLGFTNKQVNRYCKCYQRYMTLDDVGSKLKELFVSFSPSILIELLPIDIKVVEDFILNGQITSSMTVKQLREFLKSLDQEEESEEVAEEQELEENQNFLVLKNDTARKDFLDNYKTWGLWFEEPRLKLKYYRCKIGEKVLVAIFGKTEMIYYYDSPSKVVETFKYFYMSKDGEMFLDQTCVSQIIKDMSAVSDKRVYLFD